MRDVLCGIAFFGTLAILLGAFWLQIPMEVLVTWGMGLASLLWLLVLVTLPWNAHFEAKNVLFEMERSRERGIPPIADREKYAKEMAARMLRLSVLAHVLSAIVMSILTWTRGGSIGYYFAAFYLLSTFVRPGFEYYRHVMQRLHEVKTEVKYPREDVVKLRADVEGLKSHSERHEEQLGDLGAQLGDLGFRLQSNLDAVSGSAEARDHELQRKIVALSRKFEETIDRLSDNQEILKGVKAFLRLLREEDKQAGH